MQEQNQSQEQEQAPDAIVAVTNTGDGHITVKPMTLSGGYNPQTDMAHAYVQAVVDEHPNLIRRVNGQPTDADRYRALREFAIMGKTDKARFEKINEQFQKLEETLPEPDQRTAADHDQVADFIAFALLESEPVLTAPTTLPDGAADEAVPVIQMPRPKLAKPH